MKESTVNPGSFRDPSGFVFERSGRVYRQVNNRYRQDFEALETSGLLGELVRDRLAIPYTEHPASEAPGPDCYRLLEPERIPFISYPYEWCFDQLRDAAIVTLEIQERAIGRGLSLKDASAYNIQFKGGEPVHIDTLSFERYRSGAPWVAYRQFCQHFLAPLAMMSYLDARCSQLLRAHLDGVPLDLTSRLLPRKTRYSLPLQLHIHLHARAQQRYQGGPAPPSRRTISVHQLRAVIENLRNAVLRLRAPGVRPGWANYYDMDSYTQVGLNSKKQTIARFLKQATPATVWDLGANTGMFSRICAEHGAAVISLDSDHDAVQRNYQEVRRRRETGILPLWLDVTNPSGGSGWDNRERLSFKERGRPDALLALALIHHLAVAQNVPLAKIADAWADMTARWLIVEFVPKSDPKVKLLLSSREDVFNEYDQAGFERAFERRFRLVEVSRVEDSARLLYLMEAIR